MEDTITINEAGLTGHPGEAVFSVGLDGTFSSTATTTLQLAPDDAYVLIQNTGPQQYCCGPGPTGFTLSGAQGYSGPSDVLSASGALDFTYGTPFTLYIELEAEPATMALAAFAMIVGLLLKIANQR